MNITFVDNEDMDTLSVVQCQNVPRLGEVVKHPITMTTYCVEDVEYDLLEPSNCFVYVRMFLPDTVEETTTNNQ
jgi:hypothetical protein